MRRLFVGSMGIGLFVLVVVGVSLGDSDSTQPEDDSIQGRIMRLWQGAGEVDVQPTQSGCDELEFHIDRATLAPFVTLNADEAKEEIEQALDCEWE